MKKTLHKWHSLGALMAIIPLFIISITGSILVFKVELDTWLMPQSMSLTANSSDERLPLDTLMSNVKKANSDYEIGTWEIFNDKSRTDTAYIIERGTTNWAKVYLNQYTGDVLSQPVGLSHDITDWLLDLHYKFLLETKGMFVGAMVSLILLFLGISGIIMYRKFWHHFFTLRFKLAKRVFFSDLHKMIGISSSPVLLILAFTGAYWNISLVIHEVVEHVIEEPYVMTAPMHSIDLSIQQLYEKTAKEMDSFKATYLVLPFEPNRHITFYGDVDTLNLLSSEYANFITFDKNTGEKIFMQDIRTASVFTAFEDSFRKLHFGYFAGLPSKILWCILGLSPVFLAFTGLYLYWFRHQGRNRRKYV